MSSAEEDDGDNLAQSLFGNSEQPLISFRSPGLTFEDNSDKFDYDDSVHRLEQPELLVGNNNKRSRLTLMPLRYKPDFIIDQRNRRIYQLTNRKELPQVKRRLPFTAHRGR